MFNGRSSFYNIWNIPDVDRPDDVVSAFVYKNRGSTDSIGSMQRIYQKMAIT